jgi:hypothetical protein
MRNGQPGFDVAGRTFYALRRMLDSLIRRYSMSALARPAAKIASAGIRTRALALAGFAAGFAAIPVIAHSAYLAGLGLIGLSTLLDLLTSAVARLRPETTYEDFLERVLELLWGASMPFAFALAQPERALAAMFLMLGLVARAAALTSDPKRKRVLAGAILDFGGRLVGKSELFAVYALICLFPHWFSIAAYTLGIACFVMTGSRVASFGSQRP